MLDPTNSPLDKTDSDSGGWNLLERRKGNRVKTLLRLIQCFFNFTGYYEKV
jgi:hypothetical protein